MKERNEVTKQSTQISNLTTELQSSKKEVDKLQIQIGTRNYESQISDTTEDHSIEMLQELEITCRISYKAALEKIARSTPTENAKKKNSDFKKKLEKQISEAKSIKPQRGFFGQKLDGKGDAKI